MGFAREYMQPAYTQPLGPNVSLTRATPHKHTFETVAVYRKLLLEALGVSSGCLQAPILHHAASELSSQMSCHAVECPTLSAIDTEKQSKNISRIMRIVVEVNVGVTSPTDHVLVGFDFCRWRLNPSPPLSCPPTMEHFKPSFSPSSALPADEVNTSCVYTLPPTPDDLKHKQCVFGFRVTAHNLAILQQHIPEFEPTSPVPVWSALIAAARKLGLSPCAAQCGMPRTPNSNLIYFARSTSRGISPILISEQHLSQLSTTLGFNAVPQWIAV
ncbi:hypothetical protein BKA62DRAFT_671753 [Auriculariales sp. MPI-PUGE-AT-0066]|nr:hypothetical protein BKA62DRAFT_671753 [Auriculariales sp. MPI-PUGE-AT-0066]